MTRTRSPSLLDKGLRVGLGSLHRLIKLGRFIRQPSTFGVHALALTPERKVILVKLRYAPGWRFPGGGRHEREDMRDAVLRELREEIGMTGHGSVRPACELQGAADFRRDLAALLVVEDVLYAPRRWSWEVESIMETAIDDLPPDLSSRAAGWLAALRSLV